MSTTKDPRRYRPLAALILTGALAGFLYGTLPSAWEYRYFDTGENAGIDHYAVETWSLQLPAGYRLVKYRSTPPGPHDGYRFFPPR